jgi:hypothetical protein
MRFFLFDFALAFVALLGYRAAAGMSRDRVAALSRPGRLNPPARDPEITRVRPRIEREPAPQERALRDDSRFCQGIDGTSACGERPPHRLINFW